MTAGRPEGHSPNSLAVHLVRIKEGGDSPYTGLQILAPPWSNVCCHYMLLLKESGSSREAADEFELRANM